MLNRGPHESCLQGNQCHLFLGRCCSALTELEIAPMGGAAGFFPEKMNFPHKKDQEEGHRDLMIDFLAIKSLMGRQRESVRQKSREVAGGPCAPRAAVSGQGAGLAPSASRLCRQ